MTEFQKADLNGDGNISKQEMEIYLEAKRREMEDEDAKQLTYDIEKRVNDKIIRFEDKMDKFEAKVEDTKTELEDKLQKALDNPLSGN